MKYLIILCSVFFIFSCGKKFTLATQEDIEESKPTTICENETLAIKITPSQSIQNWDNSLKQVPRSLKVSSNIQHDYSIEAKIKVIVKQQGNDLGYYLYNSFLEGGDGVSLANQVKAYCANANYAGIKNAYSEKDSKTGQMTKMVEFWACHGPCAVQ